MAHQDYIEIGGSRIYSVTKVMQIIRKEGLEKWRGSIGNDEADEIMDEAGGFGTDFHKAAHLILTGETGEVNTENMSEWMRDKIEWFIGWVQNNIDEVLLCEENVISRKYKYQGTPDLVAIVKGIKSPVVIDYKTGTSIYKDSRYQTSAYLEAVNDDKGLKVTNRAVIHLPREKDKNQIIYFDRLSHTKDFAGFLMAKELWRNWYEK